MLNSGSSIPVVFAFDERFAAYAAVTMASLLVHADAKVEVFCLTTGLPERQADVLNRLAGRFGASLQILPLDGSAFSTWSTGYHFSAANYLRLLIPDLIDRRRVLFLDADIIVTTDVGPLFHTDLGQCWLGGCLDRLGARTSRVPLPPDDPYVNSGVLLLDLDRLREVNFLRLCEQAYAEHEQKIKWVDQDIINPVAAGHKLVLDPRWNLLITDHGVYDLERKIGGFEGRGIFHASGGVKPWMRWSDPWLRRLWQGYARLTGLPLGDMEIKPRTLNEWSMTADSLDREERWKESTAIRRQLIDRMQAVLKRQKISGKKPPHN